jgi:hypothetical protein
MMAKTPRIMNLSAKEVREAWRFFIPSNQEIGVEDS